MLKVIDPVRWEAAIISSRPWSERVTGFSLMTCLPASMASMA